MALIYTGEIRLATLVSSEQYSFYHFFFHNHRVKREICFNIALTDLHMSFQMARVVSNDQKSSTEEA